MAFLAYKVQSKGIFPFSRYHVSFLRGRGKSNHVLSLETCNVVLFVSLEHSCDQTWQVADCRLRQFAGQQLTDINGL